MGIVKSRLSRCIAVILGMVLILALPVCAAYESDQYIEAERLLAPAAGLAEAGSMQDIIYKITGDEFGLDPAQVDQNYVVQKNIVLVLDVSGSMSMSINGTKTRLDVLKESTINFINKMAGTNTRIAIAAYATDANTSTQLMPVNVPSNVDYLVSYVNGLRVNGNTNIGDGMRRAYWMLESTPSNSARYAIVMTDGEPNYYTAMTSGTTAPYKLDNGNAQFTYINTSKSLEYAKIFGGKLNEENVKSYFVGLISTNSTYLETISVSANAAVTEAGRHYYKVTTAAQVDNIYNSIIYNDIVSKLPITVSFNEVFPLGVAIENVPSGLNISVMTDGSYSVSGSINNMALFKDESTGKFSITPWEGTIRVRYSTLGTKDFNNFAITYTDPFGNNKTAVNKNSVSVTVTDTTAPTIPGAINIIKNDGASVEIGWAASYDYVGVAGYEVLKNGQVLGTTATNSFTDLDIDQGAAYSYAVRAYDVSGNKSAQSEAVTVMIPDVQAPSAPSDLSVQFRNSKSIGLSWEASTDNIGVVNYKLYRDQKYLTSVNETSYTDSGLETGVTYSYTVTAVDAAGNESGKSNEAAARTNLAPVADAGPDITVEANGASTYVVLNGSGSNDPDGDLLTYTWTGVFGTVTGINAQVQLPLGESTAVLSVSDGDLTSTDSVIINVVDTTPPAIAGAATTSPNTNGWYKSDVTIEFTANDTGSGISSVTPSTAISSEGENQSVTGTAVDNAGNKASVTIGGINIDKTAPVITGEAVEAPNASGWYNSNVKVIFSAYDDLSGVDNATPEIIASSEGFAQSVTGMVQDKAGNSASVAVGNINIDKTGPVISILTAVQSYKTGESIVIDYSATDGLSGVEVISASLNNMPVDKGQQVSLAALAGSNTLTVTAKDVAGNISTSSVTFNVTIDATAEISPKTLNTKSKGGNNSVTAHVGLAAGYDAASIEVSTVKMIICGKTVNAQLSPSSVSDDNCLMIKFDRQDMIAALDGVNGEIIVIINGNLKDGRSFAGTGSFRVNK